MNTKSKHFSLSGLAYALVLILLATTMVGIVAYAAGSKTHNIGGNVTFSADGVEATVAATNWEGCTIGGATYSAGQTVLSEITYSTDISTKSDMESAVETWENMNVVVTNTDGFETTSGDTLSAGVATLTFKVTNNSNDTLSISLNGSITKEEESDNTISITTSVDDETAYIGANSDTSVTITFAVTSASYDATVTGFEIPFTIDKVDNSLTTAAGLTYVYEGTEATLVSYSGSASEVEIDSTISVDEASAQAVASTASEQKIAAFANNEEWQTISAQSTSYSVTAIAANAFSSSNCEGITKITLPKTITSIGSCAFVGCTTLETIINKSSAVEISNQEFSTYGIADGVTITTGYTVTIIVDSSSGTSGSAYYVRAAGLYTYISINGENWVSLTTLDEYDTESDYTTFTVSNVFTINFAWSPDSGEVSANYASMGSSSYVRVSGLGDSVDLTENDSAGMGAVEIDSDVTVTVIEFI